VLGKIGEGRKSALMLAFSVKIGKIFTRKIPRILPHINSLETMILYGLIGLLTSMILKDQGIYILKA